MVYSATSPSCVVAGTLCCAVAATAVAAGANAEEQKRSYRLPRGEAAAVLAQFATESGRPILFMMDAVRGEQTNALAGNYTPREALDRLLAGTALVAVQDPKSGGFIVNRRAAVWPAGDAAKSGSGQPNAMSSPRTSATTTMSDPAPVATHPIARETEPAKALRPTGPLSVLAAWLALVIGPAHSMPGADARETSTVEGRVADATGGYLGNARVSAGTTHETFTDSFGHYRLTRVTPGTIRLRVFYTGFPAQERAVDVAAGQRVTQDFLLDASGTAGPEAPITLDSFIVAASRDMSAAALAVNEQRFSQQIKTVVATDTFGDIADGNVGEFVKFLPGVSLGFTGGQASSISIGGLPPESTPITIDGNGVASVGFTGESRAIQLDQISINNMSRVEVSRSQNPDSPANGIGGSVNLVPKSAFERRSPTYVAKVYSTFVDHALKGDPFKFLPNFEVSAIVPVNARFGFAFNATSAETQASQYATRPIWVPTSSATTANLPATSPALPYLARYEVSDFPKGVERKSVGLSADWRLSAYDVISLGLQYGFFNEKLNGLPRDAVFFNPGRVIAWGADFTQGAAGAGFAQLQYSTRDATGTTYQPNLRWRHQGPIWKLEAGGAFSRASYHDRNVDKGFWGPMGVFQRNLTIRFDHHAYLRPGGITVTNSAGQPVDLFKVADYRLETVGSNPVDRYDFVRSFNAHARREFGRRVPVTVKVGLDYRAQTRDLRGGAETYNYVGADGVARTADDSVARWIWPASLNRQAKWGLPKNEGINPVAVYDSYRANPAHFQLTAANEVAGYRNRVNASKRMTEAVFASYLRFDLASLLDRRLALTGGVRFEQTEFDGVGPLINPGAIYQRDAAGNVVRNTAGQPVVIAPLATLAGTQLAYTDRGARTERSYGDLYPSLNASYQLRPDLLVRASYARSIARPNFNHILPSLNLPDESSTVRTVTLTNPNLKPWEADSYGLSLEYYFAEKSAGLLSARGYLREIKNFWGAVTAPISEDLIDTYGLDGNIYSAERGYVVSTRRNVGNARVSGAEFEYRQNLTFLPSWATGFAIFGNLTLQHLEGDTTADFTGFVQKTINYGLSFNRARVTTRVSVNDRGRERREMFTGAGVEPGVYEYMAPKLTVDWSFEYRFVRHFAVYSTVRNLFNAPEDFERYGPSTPGYAKLRQRTDFRPLWAVGVKATY